MPDFTITIGNDIIGWTGYDSQGDDMDEALMECNAVPEQLQGVDEGEIIIKIKAN